MKKDLPSLKEQDKEIVREDDEEQEIGQGLRKEDPDMLSEDMRMDILRQKWEQQEMENLEKDTVHYTDVRFDEARNHGAGFYKFSKDEKRNQEQNTLRKTHEETNEMRKQRKKNEKRKREMTEKIKKIKNKKRQKQGLPPLSDDESDNDTKDAKDSDSDDDPADEDISKSVMEGLKMFRRDIKEMERQRNSAMRVASSTARDWDREKEVQEDDL